MNPLPEVWSQPGPYLTSSPAGPMSGETQTPHLKVMTEIMTDDVTDISSDDGNFAALIGGIIGGLLLVLTCIIVVLLWCLSRHKGSYVTNEMDDDGEMVHDDDDDDDDDESLQLKQPLQIKEDE